MRIRRVLGPLGLVPVVVTIAFLACTPSPGTACRGAGGSCVIGGGDCAEFAPASAQDCLANGSPGGESCCLTFIDSGTGGADAALDAQAVDAACAPDASCPACTTDADCPGAQPGSCQRGQCVP